MADFYEQLVDWSAGIQSASEGDLISPNAATLAYNTAFKSISSGQAVLGTRNGLKIGNSTALTGTPTLIWMKPYHYNSSGNITRYTVIVTSNGELYFRNTDDTLTSELLPPANFPNASTCFVDGTAFIDGTVVDNILFLLNSAGEKRCLVNQTFKAWGLEPLGSVAISNVSGGSSSMPTGDYTVWVTSYDASTGMESSSYQVGTVTLGSNERVRVQITPTSGEIAQYPGWRVYLRRDTTQATGYRVLTLENSGGTTIVSDGEIPIGTTDVYIDLTSNQIANLILQVPTSTENDPPPSSMIYAAVYGQRIVGADRHSIYWSKLDNLGAFDPTQTERIDTGEGDGIKGLATFNDDLLLIFTENNVMGLYGNDPQTWVLKPIDLSLGCASHLSVVNTPIGVAWWAPTVGPVAFDGQNITTLALEKLGQPFISSEVEKTRLNYIYAGYDTVGQRILWSYSLSGSTTKNNAIVPFKINMGQWEASKWDPMDIASMSMGFDDEGQQFLYVGNYAGQYFWFHPTTYNDGVPSGTVTGTFVATDTSHSTISGTGFYTTGAGLAQRKVTILDSSNRPISRGTIASNTSTTLTFQSVVTGLATGQTYTYHIGGPDVRLYTKWFDGQQPFIRKRFDRVFIHARSESSSTNFYLSTQIDFIDETAPAVESVVLPGGTWDVSLWDSFLWGGAGTLKKRIGVFKNANALRVVLFHSNPDVDVVFLKIALLGRMLSDRYL